MKIDALSRMPFAPLLQGSRLFTACAFALVALAAHADDYADVNALLRQGKADEALAKADAYVGSHPRDPQMRFLRGVILTEQGKQSDAITAFSQINQEFPELPEPYNNLAALYAGQGQFDKARAALEMAVKLNPNYATAQENLGDIYARLAAQSYTKAQQLDANATSIAPKLALVRQVGSAGAPATEAQAAPASNRRPVRR